MRVIERSIALLYSFYRKKDGFFISGFSTNLFWQLPSSMEKIAVGYEKYTCA